MNLEINNADENYFEYKGRDGENFVNHIAFNSFLKYWCFPGPVDILGDQKEICDLLVWFDDICLIISVKNYEFKGDYSRYFRKTIEKSIRQIEGAERKLFRDQPVLIKHSDRQDVLFEKEKINEVYRIIINLNPNVKYYQTSHLKDKKVFTVMDAVAWQSSMSELDTLPDIISYIKARCNLFSKRPAFMFPRSEFDISTNDKISAHAEIEEVATQHDGFTILSGSELDLIAEYVKRGFRFPKELTEHNLNGMVLNMDGEWDKFQRRTGRSVSLRPS